MASSQFQIIDFLFSTLLALCIALPRTLLALRQMPMFFFNTNPLRIRVAVAGAMALPVAVLVYYQLGQRPILIIEVVWIIFKEVLIGMIIGLLISMPFWILQNIGVLVDHQRGNTMFPNSPGNDPDSLPTGEFIKRFGVIIFMEMGMMASVFSSLMDSYTIWLPLNPIPPIDAMRLDLIIDRFNSMMISTILYSSPVILVLLLIEFGFGLLSIYAPQIHVTTAAPALKSLFALIILMLGANTLLYVMGNEFNLVKDIMNIINYKR